MKTVLTLHPRMSEKSYGLSEALNTYVFDVPTSANKHDIAAAVAKQYGVKVQKVTVAASAGKTRRIVKKGGRSIYKGNSSPVRKAYVRLGEGDKLPIFASVAKDEQDKQEDPKKSDKSSKADTKKISETKDKSAKAVAKPEKRGRRFGLNIRGNR
jgi:ribosomal protein L23